jgi:hypothetical protein
MKSFFRNVGLLFFTVIIFACQSSKNMTETFVITPNGQAYAVVSLDAEKLKNFLQKNDAQMLQVKNVEEGSLLNHQWVKDANGQLVELLVGVDFKQQKEVTIEISAGTESSELPEIRTFSRFVPERTDDYTWENDKVAFRTYGPEALRRVKAKEAGGTFSSGIDAWHKKVSYPIIDKWYQKELSGVGTYHADTGEGADFYHVGISRGVGGTGFWHQDTLYAAENFIRYQTLSEGPLRTVFELEYAPYIVDGVSIKETKTISLDLGSQLTKYEIQIDSSEPLPYLTVGITLHENEGIIFFDDQKGYFGYWEPMQGTSIGTGMVVNPEQIVGHIKHESTHKDQSHILVHVRPNAENKVVFYAGFAWDQAQEIQSESEWKNYLMKFSEKLKNTIVVE